MSLVQYPCFDFHVFLFPDANSWHWLATAVVEQTEAGRAMSFWLGCRKKKKKPRLGLSHSLWFFIKRIAFMISTPEAEAGAQGRCSGFKQRVWGGHSCLCRDSWSLLPALGRYSRTGLAGWRGQSGDSCLQPGEQDVTGSELGSRPVTPGHLGSGDCAFARGEAGSWPFLGVKAEVLLSYNSSKNYCFENDKSKAKNRVRRAGSSLAAVRHCYSWGPERCSSSGKSFGSCFSRKGCSSCCGQGRQGHRQPELTPAGITDWHSDKPWTGWEQWLETQQTSVEWSLWGQTSSGHHSITNPVN